jgi:cytoskeletal protein RodZ
MKTIKTFSIIIVCLLTFTTISCKDNEKEESKVEATTTEEATTATPSKANTSTETKYNPEHGVEGHRCDLPVGAPLTNAGNNTSNTMNTSPVRLQGATPKINPPHGEPGHDCSVAVGAELN